MRPAEQGADEPAGRSRSPWLDRTLGVTLGVLVGVAVVTAFVFLGSESTIDAPRISGVDSGKPGERVQRIPLVRVIDGAPPPSGPVTVDLKQGQRARIAVDSNIAIGIEITSYGVSETVGPGQSIVSFKASKPGQFPMIVTGSSIGIASVRVARAQ